MKIAVLGYGAMGQNHARVLRRLGHRVVTVDPAGHADYTSLVKHDLADGACIATTPAQLLPAVEQCEAAELRILLVEKPLAATLAQAATLAVRLPPDVYVGYVERFNPVLPALEQLLPTLGEIRHIQVKRLGLEQRNELGAYRDLATHDIDLLDALCIPLDERVEFDVGYGVTKERTWTIQGEDETITVDWQHQRIGATAHPHFEQAEPLERQWRAILAREKPPVDPRAATQILRWAIRLEQEYEPIAA